MDNFEAQRAEIMAELTQIVLLGGDTAKARAKLARLGEREALAAEAERERAEALRQQADADMAARVAELAEGAVERLHMAGIDVAGTDAQTLQAYARTVARHEAEIQTAGHAFVLAQAKVEQVQDRITALSDRANALSALRLTGQATDRDAGEAVLIERDMRTLLQALTQAQSELARVQVPDGIRHQHQAALATPQAHERAITLNCLRNRANAAEAAFLNAVRELVVASGFVHPSHAFTRDPALDRFVNFGHL